MLDALAALGCGLRREGDALHVTGLGGRLATREAKLFLGNAAPPCGPLTAALAVLAATQGGSLRALWRGPHARAGRLATWCRP